jgi:hypothetical protein
MARNGILLTLVLWLASAFVAPAFAQSTNAAPDVSMNDAAFEPAKLPGLSDAAKQALANAAQQMKSGDWVGYVLVSSPDFSVWRFSAILKTPPVYSVSDVARAVLETCEYDSGAPCYILSISGHDMQKRGGGWTTQPEMLVSKLSEFDERTVPFVLETDRQKMSAYRRASGNRVFVVTTSGSWLWRAGDTVPKAIATAAADCATSFSGANCLVYAVNNRVVFDPR